MFSHKLYRLRPYVAGLLLFALCCASLSGLSVQAQDGIPLRRANRQQLTRSQSDLPFKQTGALPSTTQAPTTRTGGDSVLSAVTNLTKGLQGVPRADKMSPDLFAKVGKRSVGRATLRVVCQFNRTPGEAVNAIYQRPNVHVDYSLDNLNVAVATMPASTVGELSALKEVTFITPDREVRTLGHISATTGADLVRYQATPGLDGTGIGIAVLDSGIKHSHKSFRDGRTTSSNVRIVAEQDFVNYNGATDDAYGHGTHVASLAAGNGRIANGAYIGIASNADIINLRVLDDRGAGRVSNVLNALSWILAPVDPTKPLSATNPTNQTKYNIRVVNMSLGMPAIDSYKNDPVCQAVRRLVDAGVVVVAAAGNNGKDSQGRKVYGQIHSPGIEPSAMTVGAANTFGTDARGDDGVATYSSRGPTRGYWTDALGTRHHDNFIKPDLVAPGNKIIDAAAVDNYLLTNNPTLDAGVSPVDARRMMYLNGTSMATPVVAGAAALLLQANPSLTPNLVKALPMYTAQPLAGFNFFEQGMGELNVEGAVRLARLVRTDLSSSTTLGAPLLASS